MMDKPSCPVLFDDALSKGRSSFSKNREAAVDFLFVVEMHEPEGSEGCGGMFRRNNWWLWRFRGEVNNCLAESYNRISNAVVPVSDLSANLGRTSST